MVFTTNFELRMFFGIVGMSVVSVKNILEY
jgi:hypothetical protein